MSLLKLENVSRQFQSEPLWSGVTLTVNQGDRLGIIGPNGSGKSTLLKLIAGLEPCDSGRRLISRDTTIGYLEQTVTFPPGLTVREAIYQSQSQTLALLAQYQAICHSLEQDSHNAPSNKQLEQLTAQLDCLNAWDLETRINTVTSRMGLKNLDMAIDGLSVGQQKRAAIAQALIAEPNLLLLDEPTNHLDTLTIDWLEGFLRQYRGTLVIVTHDRYFLDRAVHSLIEVDSGQVRFYQGSYSTYLEIKQHQSELEQASAEKHSNLLRREMEWFKRGARARSTKQKARQERLVELIAQGPMRPQRTLSMDNLSASTRLGRKGLLLHNIGKSYGNKKLFEDFSLELTRGDRVGLVGVNGSGKTTLLNIIREKILPDSGWVEMGTTVSLGCYSQLIPDIDNDITALDYVQEAGQVLVRADGSTLSAETLMESFMFPRNVQRTQMSRMSGGEKRRLYLLRTLMAAPNLLLLDEPTNDLDLPTLLRLEAWLDDFAGILVVVSHDRYFLDRTVDKLLILDQGEIREYVGNYEDLPGCLHAASEPPTQTSKPVQQPRQVPVAPKKAKLSYKQTRELRSIEQELEQGDSRKEVLEQELALPSSDAARTASLYNELQTLTARMEELLIRWEELASIEQS